MGPNRSNVLYGCQTYRTLSEGFDTPDVALNLFERFCAGFVDKNLEKAMSAFTNDAKFLAPRILELSGKKALTDFFAREMPNIEDYTIEKLATWKEGDETIIEWRNGYKDKRTGKSHQVCGVTIVKVKNGLIQQMREYCNIPPA